MKQKILYLDCFSGISGDMFLGALIDSGVPLSVVETGLQALGLASEYHLHAGKTSKSGIQGTSFQVHLTDRHHDHNHDNLHHDDHHHHSDHHHNDHTHGDHHHPDDHHHQHGRTYGDIRHLIETTHLPETVRQLALKVFLEIGQAEAAVHGVPLDQVHFHEVGAIDSIVDIVGAAIALDYLKIDQIVSSPLHDGSGTIVCQHGTMPVPVPAVMKMLENTDIPYVTGTCQTELVTPTGFALVKSLAYAFGSMPQMKRLVTGYGFGQREIGRLNALRVIVGESGDPETPIAPAFSGQEGDRTNEELLAQSFDPAEMDRVVLLSCHIDNSTAEQLGFLVEILLNRGVLDVAFSPLQMKKNRPGQLLTVITPPSLEKETVGLLFTHTGTIGIRREWIDRHVMTRTLSTVTILGQTIRIKTVQWQGISRSYPEHEDVAGLARHLQISLDEANNRIRAAMDRLV
ncbi:MAG: nickel pincer cofactor biosynthesis protein LarC [Clostridia bacterium]|nr:nickel pincer cofactor biosynthesis protein LarC [Clostridia bacterium]